MNVCVHEDKLKSAGLWGSADGAVRISYLIHSYTQQSNCCKSICFAAMQQKNHFQFPKEPLFLRVYKSNDLMTLRTSLDLKKTCRTHGPNAGVFLQKESLLLSVFRVPPSISRSRGRWARKTHCKTQTLIYGGPWQIHTHVRTEGKEKPPSCQNVWVFSWPHYTVFENKRAGQTLIIYGFNTNISGSINALWAIHNPRIPDLNPGVSLVCFYFRNAALFFCFLLLLKPSR